MPEYVTYILFALGFLLLIKGADFLVEGASALAKKLSISDLVIGLTVVSFGTSAPELVVNVIASFQGSADLAVGNILGSNIANILLILGIAAMLAPIGVQTNTVWKEIPLSLLAALVLAVLANDVLMNGLPEIRIPSPEDPALLVPSTDAVLSTPDMISRGDGLILMSFFVIFLYYTYGLAQAGHEVVDGDIHDLATPKAIGYVFLGLVGLFFGGQWIVDGAVLISRNFGLSEAVIGIAVVGVGTSLPEVAASAMAAWKGRADMAVGNVVGSNIFNIFWVLGLSSMIRPIPYDPSINGDMLMTIFASVCLLMFLMLSPPFRLHRKRGAMFLVFYVTYLVVRIVWGEG